MIDRTFDINGAQIIVGFHWDTGDSSVGVRPGWNPERTGAEIKIGSMSTFVLFDVDDRLPVEEWLVDDVQVIVCDGSRQVYYADVVTAQPPTKATLALFAEVCAAVKETWVQVQAKDAVTNARETISELQMFPDEEQDLEAIEAAKKAYRRLQAEYDARYGEAQPRVGDSIRRWADRRRQSRRVSDVA